MTHMCTLALLSALLLPNLWNRTAFTGISTTFESIGRRPPAVLPELGICADGG